jgi:hypothetical protein
VPEAADVAVAVFLAFAVGADQRGGGNENLERRIAGEQGFLEPTLLGLAPDGLFGTVRHAIGAGVEPALDEPDL